MGSDRTVAIAGAGIAGLTAGAAFARQGWKVTIFERTAEPREFGAGIYLKENSLPVLDALGAGERIAADGVRVADARIVDERRNVIVQRSLANERVIISRREVLHAALLDVALQAGVDLVTSTVVDGAGVDGRLILDGGREVRADLVIGADGFGSRVRDSLRMASVVKTLRTGATRLLLPREEEPRSTEYWSYDRRVGLAPCTKDLTYAFIIGPESDPRATRVPIDKEYWTEALPHLEHVFARIEDQGVHHAHAYAYCERHVNGRVVIIGDGAHAQPPNFGQGAGVAIDAAYHLAEGLSQTSDIDAGLLAWEQEFKPRIDMVQRLTTAYDRSGALRVRSLAPARARAFHHLSTFGPSARKWQLWWRGGRPAPATPIPMPAPVAA